MVKANASFMTCFRKPRSTVSTRCYLCHTSARFNVGGASQGVTGRSGDHWGRTGGWTPRLSFIQVVQPSEAEKGMDDECRVTQDSRP